MTASLILLIIALICLFLAAVPMVLPQHPLQLGWLGLFFWVLSQLVR